MLKNPYGPIVEKIAQSVDGVIKSACLASSTIFQDHSRNAYGEFGLEVWIQIDSAEEAAYLYSVSVAVWPMWSGQFSKNTNSFWATCKTQDGPTVHFCISDFDPGYKEFKSYLDDKNRVGTTDSLLYSAICDVTGEIPF